MEISFIGHEPEKQHELNLSPPGEDQDRDLGQIDYGRFVGINYQDFTHIIATFSIYDEEIRNTTLSFSFHIYLFMSYAQIGISY